jgi:hypothetical protein
MYKHFKHSQLTVGCNKVMLYREFFQIWGKNLPSWGVQESKEWVTWDCLHQLSVYALNNSLSEHNHKAKRRRTFTS